MNDSIVANDTLNNVLDIYMCGHSVWSHIAWPIALVIIVFLISVVCILLARYRYKRQHEELEYYKNRSQNVTPPKQGVEKDASK